MQDTLKLLSAKGKLLDEFPLYTGAATVSDHLLHSAFPTFQLLTPTSRC